MVDLGAKGLVVAGAGAGATSGTQQEGLRYAMEKGVVVVTATRTGSGRVAGSRGMMVERTQSAAAARFQAGNAVQGTMPGLTPDVLAQFRRRVGGEDLAPIKARILLMLALSKSQDPVEIQRMFVEY
jgi:L-asparaginase